MARALRKADDTGGEPPIRRRLWRSGSGTGLTRGFTRSGKAVGAFALCALLALASCAKRPASTSTSALRISQRNEPADLDPATASLPDEFFIIRALSEGLLVPNPAGGEPLPGAAERYDASSDGLTYTFHLRPGLYWSNGDPVTAADFVASYRRVLTPDTAATKAHLLYAVKNAAAFAAGKLPHFDSVGFRAVDDRTLTVTLERPNRNFPLYVTSGVWIPVHPATVARYGRTWTQPDHFVGNGPFILTEWRPHQRIVVRKNPRYHHAGRVALDEIQFVRFDNQESEERAFRAGQIDVTLTVPQTKLEVYAREHPDELCRAPLAETRFISFNTTRAPLDDPRVRRALSLAMDREKIVAAVLRGGQLPTNRFLSPALTAGADAVEGTRPAGRGGSESRPYLSPNLQSDIRYDPAEARRLLAEAGYPQGKAFPRLEFAGWAQNPVLEAIQQMWRQTLGIEVQIVVHDAKVHLAALTAGQYDIAFVTNLLDVRDPVSALGDFTATAPNNFPHWHSPEFDRLLAAAERETDAKLAQQALDQAEGLLLETAVVAPVYFNTQTWLMSPRVKHWQQDALWSRQYVDVRLE